MFMYRKTVDDVRNGIFPSSFYLWVAIQIKLSMFILPIVF